jgi:hypothetical protein
MHVCHWQQSLKQHSSLTSASASLVRLLRTHASQAAGCALLQRAAAWRVVLPPLLLLLLLLIMQPVVSLVFQTQRVWLAAAC